MVWNTFKIITQNDEKSNETLHKMRNSAERMLTGCRISRKMEENAWRDTRWQEMTSECSAGGARSSV